MIAPGDSDCEKAAHGNPGIRSEARRRIRGGHVLIGRSWNSRAATAIDEGEGGTAEAGAPKRCASP
ncbi:hypothetical protein WG70_28060 [Burkholderia oklahomensis EO147]|nr:hypothetical protein WG70_28060 [Burkholderia oklahomensis EO147]KUY64702.1 hypothetical protein WG70_29350 [Burkholderia oklahomensis EO147]